MKNFLSALALVLAYIGSSILGAYQPGRLFSDDIRFAVLISMTSFLRFEVRDAITDEIVFKSSGLKANAKWAFKSAFRLDFHGHL